MTSDEERREVARRLRKVVRDYGDCPAAVICDALGIPGYGDRRDCYSGGGVLALAGMIEPTPEPTPSEWYDRGYREGMGKAEERVGRVVPVADLVEPQSKCPHYHGDRHYCSIHEDVRAIDRDALLALADDMDLHAKTSPYPSSGRYFAANARRIREALGVRDD